MSRTSSSIVLLVLLAAVQLAAAAPAAAAKYKSCNTGNATLKMTDVDKQPAVCTTQGTASFTLACLRTIAMTVKDCNVLQTSTLEKTDQGFPCYAVLFQGDMTAPNAANLTGKLAETQKAATDVATFCLKNPEACSNLQSFSSVPITVWREEGVVYIAASPSCTYTYAVSKADADLFAGSNKTPAGASKMSKGGAGLVISSPPASTANSTRSGNSTLAPKNTTSSSSAQRASAFAVAALAVLAVMLV